MSLSPNNILGKILLSGDFDGAKSLQNDKATLRDALSEELVLGREGPDWMPYENWPFTTKQKAAMQTLWQHNGSNMCSWDPSEHLFTRVSGPSRPEKVSKKCPRAFRFRVAQFVKSLEPEGQDATKGDVIKGDVINNKSAQTQRNADFRLSEKVRTFRMTIKIRSSGPPRVFSSPSWSFSLAQASKGVWNISVVFRNMVLKAKFMDSLKLRRKCCP